MAEQTQVQDEQEQNHDSSPHESSRGQEEKKAENTAQDKQHSPPNPREKRRIVFIGIVAAIVLIGGGFFWWLHARSYETTDDAQVDGHLHPLSSRIDGTVMAVGPEDNQSVKAGDLLVQLDPRDYQVALDQANASFVQAEAQTATQQPNVPITRSSNTNILETAQATVDNAVASLAAAQQDEQSTSAQFRQSQANNEKAQTDLKRYRRLPEKQEVAQSDYDQYLATAKAQAASVEQQEASLRSSAQRVAEAKAQLDQQQSRLRQAVRDAPRQLQIREATVASQKASAESAKAQAETARLRLSYTRVYAPISGIVTQRSAEGNFVKIVQRLPVRIRFSSNQPGLDLLRPGMSVEPKVSLQ